MPHWLELQTAIRDALNRATVGEIRTKITFAGKSKVSTGNDAGGFPIFGTTYEPVIVDLSGRDDKESEVTIAQEKPIFPNDGGEVISASGIQLTMVNTDTRIACTQTGAIIDPESIEGGSVQVQARIGSLNQFLNMFTGRITGLPGESFGKTVIDLLDWLYDPLRTELKYEDFGQNGSVVNGALITTGAEIIQGDGYLKFHDGYLLYDEAGNLFTSFENNKPEVIDLLDVRLKSGARLGIYTIEFLAFGGYRVTFPDSTVLQGDTSTTFDSPSLTIEPSFWQIAAGQTNFNGTKITFQCRYVLEANIFSLIKMLLERAYLQNWGAVPSDTTQASYAASVLPIVMSTLDELERRFRLIRIYVSVGNPDNEAFEKKPNKKPLNCITLAQQAADHAASSILIDNNGEIRAQGPHIFDTPIYDLIDAHHIHSFEIIGLIKDNYLTGNYGGNDSGGAYAGKIEHDLRALTGTPVQEITINFPFYKIGLSTNHVAYFARKFKEKVKLGHVRAKMQVLPQFGIAFIPGDRVRVITSKQPVISKYFEIYKVNKSCSFSLVDLELIQIQEPEGAEETPCTFNFASDSLVV